MASSRRPDPVSNACLSPSRTCEFWRRSFRSCWRLIACGLVMLATGENPIEVYRAMLNGALGDRYGLAETLVKGTPLLLAGLGVSVAFRMQLWNIGAEARSIGRDLRHLVALFVLPGRRRLGHDPGHGRRRDDRRRDLGRDSRRAAGLLRRQRNDHHARCSTTSRSSSATISSMARGKTRSRHGFPGTEHFPSRPGCRIWRPYRVHLGLLVRTGRGRHSLVRACAALAGDMKSG